MVIPLPGARISPLSPETERVFGVDASRPVRQDDLHRPLIPQERVLFQGGGHVVTNEDGLRDVLALLRHRELQEYIDRQPLVPAPLYRSDRGRYLAQMQDWYVELIRFSGEIPIQGALARWCQMSSQLYRAWIHFNLPGLEERDLSLRTLSRFEWCSLQCLNAAGAWTQWPRPNVQERRRLAEAYAASVGYPMGMAELDALVADLDDRIPR